MTQYISKDTLVAEIERIKKEECPIDTYEGRSKLFYFEQFLSFINTLEVKESDETAEAFARIIRANLTGIDKDVQYKFEQLYKEITGKKMYQGYND